MEEKEEERDDRKREKEEGEKEITILEEAEHCSPLTVGFLPAPHPALLSWVCVSGPTGCQLNTHRKQFLLLLLTFLETVSFCVSRMMEKAITAATWLQGGGGNWTPDPPRGWVGMPDERH